MRGSRIKQLRERLGYTQEDLSDMIGISTATVSSWERGSKITSDNLEKLVRALETSADFVLGFTDDPTPYDNLKNELSPQEQEIISSMRRGDTVGAIKAIVNNE